MSKPTNAFAGQTAEQLLRLGLQHHQSGRLAEAEIVYREILGMWPNYPDALHLSGLIAFQRGQSGVAVVLIGKAIEATPFNPMFHSNLGLALKAQGRLNEAIKSYSKALSINTNIAEVHFNLGVAYNDQGNWEEAVESYRSALVIRPNYAEAYCMLGKALCEQGQLEEAVVSYQKALALRPGNIEVLRNMGNTLHNQGKLDEAITCLRLVLAVRQDDAEVHNNLGILLGKQGKLEDAVASFQRALSIAPDYAEANNNLGNVLKDEHKLDAAAELYRKAITLRPNYAEAYCNLGSTLRSLGRLDEARTILHRALAINPDLAMIHTHLAAIYDDLGQFDAARVELSKAMESELEFPYAFAVLANLRKMSPEDSNWLDTALRLVSNPAQSLENRISLQFSIGKYYDDNRQYDLAFSAYRQANMLTRQVQGKFDRSGFSRLVDGLIATYSKDFMGRSKRVASSSRLPVLIIGMVRSGTSLTEQIIASHPDAYGAGELAFWSNLLTDNWAAVLSGSYGDSFISDASAEYEQHLRRYSADAHRIVDKMPGNFLLAGLIHLIFPQAKIIHTRRNPIDTCLSVYFQNLSRLHVYGTDLDDLAFYYREYDRLMRHWREVLPADRFLEVSYEAITDNPGESSRQIIEFIGLQWNERCMEFYKIERRVGTSSNWQVRQKIYHSSKARWQNYEKNLGPLLGLAVLDQGSLTT